MLSASKIAPFVKKTEKISTLMQTNYEFSVKIEKIFKKDLIFFPYRIKIGVAISTPIRRVPKVQTQINFNKYKRRNPNMKLNPLADRVVVKMVEMEETTKSGIILTASAKQKPQIAEVLAVGPGAMKDGKLVPMAVKVGDKVITSKYSGTEIKLDGVEYVIVSEEDILAIVE